MNKRPCRSGAVLLPFLLSFTCLAMLFGTVVEAALLLHARSKLFNGAENALLAAANIYDTTVFTDDEVNTMIKTVYCTDNFLEPDATDLDFSLASCSNILILHTSKPVPLLFSTNDVTLRCSLAAVISGTADHVHGLVPLAVLVTDTVNPFVIGQRYVIKEDGGDGVTGNYGPLALDGTGGANFLEHLKFGYGPALSIGEVVEKTEPGSMVGPVSEGIAYRAANGTTNVSVIVTDQFPNGRGPITIRGFAAFRVHEVVGGEITADYISYKVVAGTNPDAPDYGLHAKPRLIFY